MNVLIGASLNEPQIDHDNGPHARNNGIYVAIYICLYHLPCVYCTLVLEICVRLKCSVCSGILTCLHAWFTTVLDLAATRVCHEDYRRRQVGECADT